MNLFTKSLILLLGLCLCVLSVHAQEYVLVSGAAGTPSFDTACKIWRLSAGSTALELVLDLGEEIGVMPSEEYPENPKHWSVAMEVPGFYAIRAFPDEQTLVVWAHEDPDDIDTGAVFCFDVRQLPVYKRFPLPFGPSLGGRLNVTEQGVIQVLTKIGKRPGWYQVDTPYQSSLTQEVHRNTIPWEGVRWYGGRVQNSGYTGVLLDASGRGHGSMDFKGPERIRIPSQVFRHFLGTFPARRRIPINTARVMIVDAGMRSAVLDKKRGTWHLWEREFNDTKSPVIGGYGDWLTYYREPGLFDFYHLNTKKSYRVDFGAGTELLASSGEHILYKQRGGLYEARLSATGKLSEPQLRVSEVPLGLHWAIPVQTR